jgi:aspartate kinase
MITVMKFGGTSVGSVEALNRVAKIIANEKGKRVVVVSAMSGITNFLVSAVEDVKMDLNDVIKTFREKHLNVAKELFSGELYDEFMVEFEKRFSEFQKVILDKEMRNDPYYADNVSSQGERFSSLLLAFVLKSMGLKSVALTSEMAGV